MKFIAATVLVIAGSFAFAADRPPFYVAGGVSEFDKEIRDLTNDYPWTVGLGWGESEAAMFGAPSIDLEWAHAQGHGNKFDSYGVTYNERAMITDSLYFGLGIGSYYNRCDRQERQDLRRLEMVSRRPRHAGPEPGRWALRVDLHRIGLHLPWQGRRAGGQQLLTRARTLVLIDGACQPSACVAVVGHMT
jgi:hypothetical protein